MSEKTVAAAAGAAVQAAVAITIAAATVAAALARLSDAIIIIITPSTLRDTARTSTPPAQFAVMRPQ